jgi:hypothetical protein
MTGELAAELFALESDLVQHDESARDRAVEIQRNLVLLVSISPEPVSTRILELVLERPQPCLADIYAIEATDQFLIHEGESPNGLPSIPGAG